MSHMADGACAWDNNRYSAHDIARYLRNLRSRHVWAFELKPSEPHYLLTQLTDIDGGLPRDDLRRQRCQLRRLELKEILQAQACFNIHT